MKMLLGAVVVAASFALAGPMAVTPAAAKTNVAAKHDSGGASATDFSARRHHRHYHRRHYHRRYRGYYGPRYYSPYYRPYYRPYPSYYGRPYYYAPRPYVGFGFGFGPRWGW